MSHTPAVAQAPAVADAAVASPAAESSYFDPDFEFDCPKYQDFAAITARAEAAAARLQAILAATDVTGRQTPSPLSAGPLDQSHTDDWFFGDNARKLEYIGDGVVQRDQAPAQPLYREEEDTPSVAASIPAAAQLQSQMQPVHHYPAISATSASTTLGQLRYEAPAAQQPQQAQQAQTQSEPQRQQQQQQQQHSSQQHHHSESDDQEHHAKRRKLNNGQHVTGSTAVKKAAPAYVVAKGHSHSSAIQATSRSAKPLTVPQPFKFQTESRIKSRPAQPPAEQAAPSVRAPVTYASSSLATAPAVLHGTSQPPTCQQKPDAAALQHAKAQHATALAKAKLEARQTLIHATPAPVHKALTIPHQPHLHTANIVARPKPLSSEERELLEIQQAPKFKARPVNKKILYGNTGQIGVPKVSKKPPTVAVSPKLSTNGRKRSREEFEKNQEGDQSLQQVHQQKRHITEHARRTTIVRQPPARAQHSKKLAIPQTPKLSTSSRSQCRAKSSVAVSIVSQQAPEHAFRARPMSSFAAPALHAPKPAPVTKRLTVPQPFQLQSEVRGAIHQAQLAAKLEKERMQEVVPPFKARPVHIPEVPAIPFVAKPALTEPEPFELRSEYYREKVLQQWRERIQREEEERQRRAEFHAKPVPTAPPFIPKQSTRPLTIPIEASLRTSIQALHRHDYDIKNKQRLCEMEEERKRRDEDARRIAEEEVARMRREQMSFVARPLPSFYHSRSEPGTISQSSSSAALVQEDQSQAAIDRPKLAQSLQHLRFQRKAERQRFLQRVFTEQPEVATQQVHDADRSELLLQADLHAPAIDAAQVAAVSGDVVRSSTARLSAILAPGLAQDTFKGLFSSLKSTSQPSQATTSGIPKPAAMRQQRDALLQSRSSSSNKFSSQLFRVL